MLDKDDVQYVRQALTDARLEMFKAETLLAFKGWQEEAKELARIATRLHEIRLLVMKEQE